MFHAPPDAVRRGHPSPSRWQRVRRAALAVILAVSLPLAASAQQPPAPAQSAPASGVMPTARPMTMEIVIVLIMFAAAIFVVCKSSRRN